MAIVNVGGKIFLGDSVPNLDFKYGPYTSKEAAFEALGPDGDDVLAIGLTVGIQESENSPIIEYWFKDACESINDLVEKSLNQESKVIQDIELGIVEANENIEELKTTVENLKLDGGRLE